jgi:hypothetical protein
MKAERDHRVPLSKRAIAILDEMREVQDGEFPFPGGKSGKPLSNMAMLALIERMNERRRAAGQPRWTDPKHGNRDVVPHGFRSTFRDWAAERTSFPNEMVEMALAHAVDDKVEAACRRGDLFDKRRKLMDSWAAYCSAPIVGSGRRISTIANPSVSRHLFNVICNGADFIASPTATRIPRGTAKSGRSSNVREYTYDSRSYQTIHVRLNDHLCRDWPWRACNSKAGPTNCRNRI